jgi:hypothetical protein
MSTVEAGVKEAPAEASLSEKVTALEISDTKAEESTPPVAASIEKLSTTEAAVAVAPVKEPKTEEQPSGPTLLPFSHPLPTAKPAPAPTLTEDQEKKYETLLAAVKAWETIPLTSAAKSETEAITDADRLWLTRECLLRYLTATKWDEKAAEKRLLGTLTWRREYGLLGFTHDYISEENATGKQVILGYDNEGRPCLYLNPSKQNTERTPRQLQHLFYNIERVIDIMPPGQATLALLINFSDTKRGQGQGGSLTQGRETIYVLQNHYPERLGRALITERKYAYTSVKYVLTLTSPMVHFWVLQAHYSIYRSRHPYEAQIQRAHCRPRSRRAADKDFWRQC